MGAPYPMPQRITTLIIVRLQMRICMHTVRLIKQETW